MSETGRTNDELQQELNSLQKELNALKSSYERDISSLRHTEERVEHLNKVLKAIRNVNQLIVHESEPVKLVDQTCKILTEKLGYYNAWIALFDDTGKKVGLISESGFNGGFETKRENLLKGKYPSCMRFALNSANIVTVANPVADCTVCSLSDKYEGRSGYCKRLEFEGHIFGILAVSIPKEYYDDEEEISLFNELAGDLSFALHKLKTAERLRTSEANYRLIFENMAQGIMFQHADGRVIDANAALLKMFGLSKDELFGRTSMDTRWKVIREDGSDFPGEEHPSWQAIETGKPIKDVIAGVFNPLKNDFVWLQINSLPMFKAGDEKPFQSFVTFHDITERKRAEQKLRESEETYRVLVESTKDAIFSVDRNGYYKFANSAFASTLGHTPEYFVGKSFWDIYPKDLADMRYANVLKVFETGQPSDVEVVVPLPDKTLHYLAKTNPITDTQGNVFQALITATDITERKRAEEELKSSRENLFNFFNTNIDFLWVLDLNGNIIHLNNTVRNRLGYDDAELLGKSVLLAHPPKFRHQVQEIVADMLTGKRTNCPIPLQTKDGLEIPVETYVFEGKWNGNPALFGVSKDITALKLSEEKFAKAFQNSPSIIGISDIETGEFLEVNNSFYDILEYAPDEITGKKAKDLVQMDSNFREKALKILNEEGTLRNIETILWTKTGKPINVLLSADVISISGRTYNFTTAVDITERKKAEEELKIKTAFLEELIESSPEAIVILDNNDFVQRINKEFTRLFEYSSAEAVGKQINDLIVPEGFKEEAGKATNSVAIGSQIYLETQRKSKTGKVVHVSILGQPIKISEEQLGVFGIYRDITDRKLAEEELLASEERNRLLSDVTLEGIVIHKMGIAKDVNNSMSRILGYSLDELIGSDFISYVYLDDRQIVYDNLIKDYAKPYEIRMVRKNAEVFHAEIEARNFLLKGEQWRASAVRDITERKKAEEELLNEKKKTESQNRKLNHLFEASKAVLEYDNFEKTARIIFNKCKEFTGAKSGNVALLSESGEENELLFLDAGGIPCTVDESLPMPIRGLRGEAYLLGKAVYENDFMNSKHINYMPEGHCYLKNVLFAPISVNNKTVGLIGLANKLQDFNSDDLQMVTALGELASIAFRNSRNLDELVEAKKRIEISEETYRNLFQNAQVGLFRTRISDGKVLESNDQLAKMFGYENREDFIAEYISEKNYVDENIRQRMLEEIQTNGYIQNFEARLFRKDSSIIWVNYSARVLIDKGWIEGVAEDITENKKIQELRDKQLEFSNALNRISESIISMQSADDILDAANSGIGEALQADRILIYKVSFKENRITALCEWLGAEHPKIEPTKGDYTSLEMFIDAFNEIRNTKSYVESHYDSINPHFAKGGLDGLLHNRLNIKSLIWYPFDIKEDEFYIFTIYQILKKRSWAPDELQFLETVSKQVRIALLKISLLKNLEFNKGLLEQQNIELSAQYEEYMQLNETLSNTNYELELAIKKAEENEKSVKAKNLELIERNSFIQTILDNLPIGLALNKIDEGNATYMNRKFEEIYGWTSEEITSISSFFEKVYPDEEYRKELIDRIMADISSGDKERMRWENIFPTRKDGSKRVINAVNIPLPEQNTMVSTVMDITDLYNIQRELLDAKERAEESDRLKSAFLANMSHEIRTPMNGILGFAQLLKEPKLSGEEQKEFIEIIEKSGARMLNIINDLVSISKIESGQMEENLSLTNINEQLEFLNNFFKLEAKQQGLELILNCPLPKSEAIIMTDREKVYAIMTNLLKNAIKYTNSGKIEFGYTEKGSKFEFYVQDTGIGIPEDKLISVFDRFVQADSSIASGYEGAGLGLAISKGYVELLGGEIGVESRVNVGTRFWFALPAERHYETSHTKIKSKQITTDSEIMEATILIAEDDDASLKYLKSILKKSPFTLISVDNGDDAVKICKDNKDIDLVLMDIKMPLTDGHSAAKQIKSFRPDLPIIAQTAYALENEIERYRDIFDDYVTKPIAKEDMLELIAKYIS